MKIRTTTLTNQDISDYLLIDTYTIENEREYIIRVLLDQVSGNGNYSIYVEVQREGTGSFYRYDTADYVAPNGVTSIALQTILSAVTRTDVIKIYVVGTPSDTSTVDIVVDWFYQNYSTSSVSEIANGVWTNVQRTLTETIYSDTIEVNRIDLVRGDTFSFPITELDLDNCQTVYFTIKKNYKDLDYASIVQINDIEGLIYLNGIKRTDTTGADITIDEVNSEVTVTIDALITKQLQYLELGYVYDLQIIKFDGTVVTPKIGTLYVVQDVTRVVD